MSIVRKDINQDGRSSGRARQHRGFGITVRTRNRGTNKRQVEVNVLFELYKYATEKERRANQTGNMETM